MNTELVTAPSALPETFSLAPKTFDEAMRMADMMAKSSMVPKEFQGNPGNILVAVQWGAELGLPILQSLQSVAVINGRPAMFGDALLALVRRSGALESIREDVTDTGATCTVTRRGEDPVSRTFTMEDAKKASLLGKPGPWGQYPKRMMQMRARAWALRDVFPDVLRGVAVAEEARDMPAERVMGQAEVVAEEPTASRTEGIKAKLRSKRQAVPSDDQPGAEAANLVDVLARIDEAETEADLKTVADLAGKIADPLDKQFAREAFAARLQAMRDAGAGPQTDPDEAVDTAEGEHEQDAAE